MKLLSIKRLHVSLSKKSMQNRDIKYVEAMELWCNFEGKGSHSELTPLKCDVYV